jgi:hypothetical protein
MFGDIPKGCHLSTPLTDIQGVTARLSDSGTSVALRRLISARAGQRSNVRTSAFNRQTAAHNARANIDGLLNTLWADRVLGRGSSRIVAALGGTAQYLT